MGTIVVGVIVFGTIGLVVYRALQDHKKGKCSGCAYASQCGRSGIQACDAQVGSE